MKRLGVTAALAVIVAVLGTGSAPALVGPTGRGGVVRPFSVQYMNGSASVSLSEALSVARNFDVVVAHPNVFKPYLAQMRAANPQLLLFVYQKGIFTYDSGLPEDAYSHDADGNRVTGVRFPGTFMLNPLSPNVLTYEIKQATNRIADSGYDGVYLDTLGPATLSTMYVSSLPIDPRTGLPWTPADWVAGTSALGGQVAAAVSQPVMCNGLRNGSDYWPPTETRKLLRTGMGGCMAESWLRISTDPLDLYPTEAVWKQSVDALVDAGANGGSFFTETKAWGPGTPTQRDDWYHFALASYLLASDGRSYFTFSYAQGDADTVYPLDRLDLGAPLEAYVRRWRVYQRKFAQGRVLVNPSTHTFAVPLNRTYHTLDGTAVTSVTMGPHSAEILTLP